MVQLAVNVDDDGLVRVPGTNPVQYIEGADDPEVSSPLKGITAWDFTIEGPDASWRPRGGSEANTYTVNLEIRPVTDHTPPPLNSTGGHINVWFSHEDLGQVQQGASFVPGYCINREYPPPQPPTDPNLNDFRDLIFQDNQPRWTIQPLTGIQNPDLQLAESEGKEVTISIIVKSMDYGAWARLQASTTDAPFGAATARDKRKPLSNPIVAYCNMPWDEDPAVKDHIADGFDRSLDQDGYHAGAGGSNAVRDPEVLRAGNDARGDGFSDYQEYRGMIFAGVWITLGRDTPDLFIEDPNNLGFGNFSLTGILPSPLSASESQPGGGGVVDWRALPGHQVVPGGQKRILLIDAGGAGNREDPFGYTFPGPGIPRDIDRVEIYPANITDWVNFHFPVGQRPLMYQRELTHTITHELSHAVNMRHHSESNPFAPPPDIMAYATPQTISQDKHNYYCTAAGEPREVLLQMRLRN